MEPDVLIGFSAGRTKNAQGRVPWSRNQPLPARGPIMLQTHGGEIRWRNLFVREIGPAEARKILGEADRKK